jgi:hypothetical protein
VIQFRYGDPPPAVRDDDDDDDDVGAVALDPAYVLPRLVATWAAAAAAANRASGTASPFSPI